jgi:hypothetical protein
MVEPVFGRWGPTEVMERVLDGTWAEVVDGMGLIEPESIAFTGTSAAITGLGSVEFSAVTSLSLNGVFSSDFDNYMIVVRHVASSSDSQFNMRLRTTGTDESGTNYTFQYLVADATTVGANRSTSQTSVRLVCAGDATGGDVINVYGPNLLQPTALRNINAQPRGTGANIRILDQAGTHSLSSGYDGFTLIASSTPTFTGRVAVYGMVK